MTSNEKKCCCCSRKCGLISAGIVGGVLVVLGGFLVFIFNEAFESIIKTNLVIANNTDAYEAWKAPPPLYLELYLFNVTNPDEFLAGAEAKKFVKPKFQELGPYVYREILGKDQLEFFDTPDTPEELKFRSTGKYYFEPGLSKGKESDLITTLDVIAAGAPAIVEYAIYLGGNSISAVQKQALRRSLNLLIRDAGSKLLFTTTVRELLFGFKSELLSAIINTIELAPGVPDNLPDEFGLFQTMNSSVGWFDYKIYTGKEDYRLMNVVTEYEGMRELDYWFGKECNMINGTDGTTVEAFMQKDKRIYFFVDDVCRSMFATFHAEVDIKGLPAWEYRVPKELFAAPSKNKENECYCPDLSLEVCQYDGGLLLSSCQSGAPVFMTSPHFLFAEHYLNFVEGLEPIEEQHCTPLVYEPNTGLCVKADKRLQINFYMQPDQHYDILDGTFETPYAFPILWLNESYITSDQDAEVAYAYLVVPGEVFFILQIIFCIIGAVLLLGVIYSAAVLKVHRDVKNSDSDSVDSYKKVKSAYSYENDAVEMENTDQDVKTDSKGENENAYANASVGEGSSSDSLEGVPTTAL